MKYLTKILINEIPRLRFMIHDYVHIINFLLLLLLLLLIMIIACLKSIFRFTFAICRRLFVVCLLRWCTLLRRLEFSALFLRRLVRWTSIDFQEKFYGDRPRGTFAKLYLGNSAR